MMAVFKHISMGGGFAPPPDVVSACDDLVEAGEALQAAARVYHTAMTRFNHVKRESPDVNFSGRWNTTRNGNGAFEWDDRIDCWPSGRVIIANAFKR